MIPIVNLGASIAGILAIWGILWLMWDSGAKAPAVLLLAALVLFGIYELFT